MKIRKWKYVLNTNFFFAHAGNDDKATRIVYKLKLVTYEIVLILFSEQYLYFKFYIIIMTIIILYLNSV